LGVTITPLPYVQLYSIRVGDKHFKYGDPYQFTVVFSFDGKEAKFQLGCGKLNVRSAREIRKALIDFGVRKGTWARVKNEVFLKREYRG